MHETVWDAPAQEGKKTAVTYRQIKNATSTQAATWERDNGQEKTKGLLRMTYVSWTNLRSNTNIMHSNDSAQNRKYVRCFPENELSKELSLSSFPPSTHSRPFHPPIRCSFGVVFFVNYHSFSCSLFPQDVFYNISYILPYFNCRLLITSFCFFFVFVSNI